MYVKPDQVLQQATELGSIKCTLPSKDIFIRGFLSAGILGIATALAIYVSAQVHNSVVGALVFPVGFSMLTLLGLELVTGNFALSLFPLWRKLVTVRDVLRNWVVAYISHIIGGAVVAYLIWVAWTASGASGASDAWSVQLISITEKKTLFYAKYGLAGLWVAFVKAILCNWMVSLASILVLSAQHVVGKILAMWMPIFTFFAMGFEHSVVNLFLIPAGIIMGADVTIGQWWVWNQIPVTMGNIVGAAVFTAGGLYATYAK